VTPRDQLKVLAKPLNRDQRGISLSRTFLDGDGDHLYAIQVT